MKHKSIVFSEHIVFLSQNSYMIYALFSRNLFSGFTHICVNFPIAEKQTPLFRCPRVCAAYSCWTLVHVGCYTYIIFVIFAPKTGMLSSLLVHTKVHKLRQTGYCVKPNSVNHEKTAFIVDLSCGASL